MTRVVFLGAGRWAQALALGLVREETEPALWEPDETALARFVESRRHPDLPEPAVLPESVPVSSDLAAIAKRAAVAVFAVPSGALAETCRRSLALLPDTVRTVVTVTKGIDPTSLKRLSVVITEAMRPRPVVVLAGPGIPYDYAAGDPTSLVAASEDEGAARYVRDLFTAGNLRVYSSRDVVGVELGAALKNVIALAAGVCDGIGLGVNAKAALLARGLAEMTRLGIAQGANPMTFAGLSGMGDLVVTAFSERSRNHALGFHIGRGDTLDEAAHRLNGVAEGALTCRTALVLSRRYNVEMPITEEVSRILYEGSDPKQSLKRLLRRKTKAESESEKKG